MNTPTNSIRLYFPSQTTPILFQCVAGARVVDICRAGDDSINQKASLIFRGKGKDGKLMEKGVAFPVCVSVNDCVCHMSPLESDEPVSPFSLFLYLCLLSIFVITGRAHDASDRRPLPPGTAGLS